MMEEHGGGDTGPTVTTSSTGDNELEDNGAGNIKIKVTFGSNNFDIFTSPQSTFGDLKPEIAKATGVDPEAQKDEAKVILIEKVEEIKENIEEISRGLEAVNRVREENNQFAEQVVSLETVVSCGTKIDDKDLIYLTEMLMRQLLKLDGIDAEGEGRMQRKSEVRRVQGLVENLDNLRAKNSELTSKVSKL